MTAFLYGVMIHVRKLNKKLVRALQMDCDPAQYVQTWEKLLHKKGVPQTAKTLARLNLSTGYLNLEDTEKAKKHLEAVQYFPKGRKNAMYQAAVYNNWALYHAQMSDIESMAEAIENVRKVISKCKSSSLVYAYCQRHYKQIQMHLNILREEYVDSEFFYREALRNVRNELGKVYASYWLGAVCLHNGENEKAAEALTFAVERGKDTYWAKEAAKLLKEM